MNERKSNSRANDIMLAYIVAIVIYIFFYGIICFCQWKLVSPVYWITGLPTFDALERFGSLIFALLLMVGPFIAGLVKE